MTFFASTATAAPLRPDSGSAQSAPSMVAAAGHSRWDSVQRMAGYAFLPAALGLMLAFQGTPSHALSHESPASAPAKPIQISSQDPANALAIAQRVMGTGANQRDTAMEAQLARALGKYEGLPHLASLSVWKEAKAAAPDPDLSSRSIPLKGNECGLAMATRTDGSRAGGSAEEAKRNDKLYKNWSHVQQQEIDALHEMGHCMHYANQVGFKSSHLTPKQNDALNQTVFSWQAPAGTGGAGNTPASLFSENYADAYSALKWMEARGFSQDSKQLLATLAQERTETRIDKNVTEKHPDGTFNAHFTEISVIKMVQNADRLKAMTPAQRVDFAQTVASDSSLAILSKIGSASEVAKELMDPVALASRTGIDAAIEKIASVSGSKAVANEKAPVRDGSGFDAAMAKLRVAASARFGELMAADGITPAMLATAATSGQSSPKIEALFGKIQMDAKLIATSESLLKGAKGVDFESASDAYSQGIKAERHQTVLSSTGPAARQAALAEALSAPGALKIGAYRQARSQQTSDSPAPAPKAHAPSM